MKSEEEIRARIEFLTKRAEQPKTKKTLLPLLFTAEDALQWVLGINDEDAGWSLQRRYDVESQQ